MRGYFKANEIRSMALDKTDVLELVTRDDFVGLTIIHEDGSAGVLSLAQDRFDIFPASETLVTALACR
ncbi:MAG: hypothetical protein KDI80_16770, partial [Xanthomonadales bacterium]|nr:hypothetical protein [Xanthomonadales bacterium]